MDVQEVRDGSYHLLPRRVLLQFGESENDASQEDVFEVSPEF